MSRSTEPQFKIPKVSFLDCLHAHRDPNNRDVCLDCTYDVRLSKERYLMMLCSMVVAASEDLTSTIHELERILGIPRGEPKTAGAAPADQHETAPDEVSAPS